MFECPITNKMKAKFCYFDQIKINEPALNQEHQNSNISLTTTYSGYQSHAPSNDFFLF